ncbi:MAG: methylglyoxal synthase [Lachnospiraceae bacterium]|jgi:methylglyoxal synthase|nr:methylglyoxal synthase [Lachnospiraceae bacterium]
MNIGLIAHESKKMLMQNFCIAYKGILSRNDIFATGTTGRMVEAVTNLNVHKFLPGNLGGMQQLGSQIENNTMDAVIFLREPNRTGPRDMGAEEIINLCDTYNIPIATNLATAELVILAIDRGDLDWREIYK